MTAAPRLAVVSSDPPPVRDDGRPRIVVAPGEMRRMVAEAEHVLLGLYFKRDGLVRLARDPDLAPRTGVRFAAGALTVQPVSVDWLLLRLAEVATLVRRDGRSRRMAPIDPPMQLARSILAQADSSEAPDLLGVLEHPTLRADGSLIAQPGYDALSGLYLDFDRDAFPDLSSTPTRQEVERALDALLELLAEFPFARAEHRSVAVALLLTAVVRASLHTAPGFGITAPAAGSGKTFLSLLVGWLQSGRDPAMLSVPPNDEQEFRKRLFSVMLRMPGAVVFDNVERPLGSESLCTFLTTSVWRERFLGVSRDHAVPTNTVVVVTGNNLALVGDLTRRFLLCRIDPGVERPEEREFTRDLRAHVLRHRPRLVTAALTIMRGYVAAGRPRPAGTKPLGSFESWDRLVRGAVLWLGLPDPVGTRLELVESDPVRERLTALLSAWHEAFGERRITASDLIFEAAKVPRLKNALLPLAEERGELSAKKLGYSLRSLTGRIADGLRLVKAGRTEYGQSFTVEVCDAA